MTTSVPGLLAARMAGDPAQPLVTFVASDGARTELSVRTFDNNVAKTANLLQDEAGPGSRVALRLPVHWQVAVWLGACAAAGCVADVDGDASSAELAVIGPAELAPTGAPLTLATSLDPLGRPFGRALPAGVLDAAVEVRAQADRFAPYDPPVAGSRWLMLGERAWTQGDALDAASQLADDVGLPPGGRLLCARPLGLRAVLACLAVPLVRRGSVVLLEAFDDDVVERAGLQERCDAVLR